MSCKRDECGLYSAVIQSTLWLLSSCECWVVIAELPEINLGQQRKIASLECETVVDIQRDVLNVLYVSINLYVTGQPPNKTELNIWPELLSHKKLTGAKGVGNHSHYCALQLSCSNWNCIWCFMLFHASDTVCDCTGEYNLRLGITKELHPELVSTHQGKFPIHVGQVDYRADSLLIIQKLFCFFVNTGLMIQQTDW